VRKKVRGFGGGSPLEKKRIKKPRFGGIYRIAKLIFKYFKKGNESNNII
jgi:hypothetical protein